MQWNDTHSADVHLQSHAATRLIKIEKDAEGLFTHLFFCKPHPHTKYIHSLWHPQNIH